MLLAPPFCLAVVVHALVAWRFGRASLLMALLAAEVGFFVYFAVWHLVPGGLDAVPHDHANLRQAVDAGTCLPSVGLRNRER